jgi:hypothetical protein
VSTGCGCWRSPLSLFANPGAAQRPQTGWSRASARSTRPHAPAQKAASRALASSDKVGQPQRQSLSKHSDYSGCSTRRVRALILVSRHVFRLNKTQRRPDSIFGRAWTHGRKQRENPETIRAWGLSIECELCLRRASLHLYCPDRDILVRYQWALPR